MREIIETKAAPGPIGPYSQAIRANGFDLRFRSDSGPAGYGLVVEGGHRSPDASGDEESFRNSGCRGSGLDKVVKTTVFLSNLDDFSGFNRIYGEYFGEAKPARATVQVARLPKEVLLEIEAIAVA